MLSSKLIPALYWRGQQTIGAAVGKEPTVQQLRCFQALGAELHYGRAARRLHISQPPLTRHMQNLEAAVGVALVARKGRGIELTDAGESFLADVELVLARLDRGIATAKQIDAGEAGELVIGYVEPLGIDLMPRVLRSFRDLHPHHSLRLFEMHTPEQVAALRDGAIDCGLLRTPSSSTTDLSFEVVSGDNLCVALSERHPLVQADMVRNGVSLPELEHEPFVVYETGLGVGILTTILTACAKAGFSPAVSHVATSTPMLLALVAASEGVALVSNEIARLPRPGVTFCAVSSEPIVSDVLLGWRRTDESVALADLRQVVRSIARQSAVTRDP